MIERTRTTDASTISGHTIARWRCFRSGLPDSPGAGFPEGSGTGPGVRSGDGEVSESSGILGALGGQPYCELSSQRRVVGAQPTPTNLRRWRGGRRISGHGLHLQSARIDLLDSRPHHRRLGVLTTLGFAVAFAIHTLV